MSGYAEMGPPIEANVLREVGGKKLSNLSPVCAVVAEDSSTFSLQA